MDLSNLKPAVGSKHSDSFRKEVVVTHQATVRLLVRDMRDRKLVPALRDQDLKV